MEQFKTVRVGSLSNFEDIRGQVEMVDRFLGYARTFLPDAILAGGAPRDWILGLPPTDYDIFTSDGEGIDQLLKEFEKDGVTYEEAGKEYDGADSEFRVWNFTWEDRSFQLIVLKQGRTPLDGIERFPVNISKVLYGDGFLSVHRHFNYFMKFEAVIWEEGTNYLYEDKILSKLRDAGLRARSVYGVKTFLMTRFQWGNSSGYLMGRELAMEREKGFYNPFDNYRARTEIF